MFGSESHRGYDAFYVLGFIHKSGVEVLFVNHTDNAVDRISVYGHSRKAVFRKFLSDLVHRRVFFHGDNVYPRDENIADFGVVELDRAR